MPVHAPGARAHRGRLSAVVLGALLAVSPLPAPGPIGTASAGPDGGPGVEILEEVPLVGEFMDEGTETDDVVVLWDEVLDPRFMPDPADFDITINGIVWDPDRVDLLFAGLARPDFIFGADGTSFMQLDLPAGVTYGIDDTVTIAYVPTATPVRDLALNESPGFPEVPVIPLDVGDFIPILAVVDSYHGANKIVLAVTEPVVPASLPAPAQFTVEIDGNPVGVQLVDDLSPGVGMALIELTLDAEVEDQASVVTVDYAGSPTTMRSAYTDAPLVSQNDITAELFIASNAAAAEQAAGVPITTATPEGPTTADPVATTIVPAVDGFVSITESTVEEEPAAGYEFFGHQVDITMPDASSPAQPHVLTFALDASAIPEGQDETTIQVFRDGVAVLDCQGAPGVADPTPCVSERLPLDDGDISFTVLTVQASSWNLGFTPPYEFDGFFAPIDNGVPNIVKAGRAIPVKFSLGGDRGLDIFADGSPSVHSLACSDLEDGDLIEETVAAGQSGLEYDAGTDTYTYVWKTNRAWTDTCRRLVLEFADGTLATAVFSFSR